ncbi:MAG: TRAP transporter substrate-binding protein [Cyclobacteriaceae bacterium]
MILSESFQIKYTTLFLSLILLFGCKSEKEPEVLLRASLITNEDHTWSRAFEFFSKRLEEKSDGRIRLEVYHAEQLSKEIESIRLIQAGVIDMTITASILTNWVDEAVFCELPFLLRDSKDLQKLVNHPISDYMEAQIINKTGLRPVTYFERGPRHLTSNRPITHPDELKGIIIRVPTVPVYVTAWEAMGAKPTPMAFSEVFTSLQQNTIEAQENPLAMIKAAGFAEVQSHLNLTGHVVSWAYPVLGEKQYQDMPEDLRKIFMECAEEMHQFERKLFLENEQTLAKELKEKGMTFVEVDKDAFANKCTEAIYKSLSPDMQKIYNEILTVTRN